MRRKELEFAKGETRIVRNDWTAECEERAATVQASVWEITGGHALSSPSLTGSVATVRVTFTETAEETLTNTVVLSNGETLMATRAVTAS